MKRKKKIKTRYVLDSKRAQTREGVVREGIRQSLPGGFSIEPRWKIVESIGKGILENEHFQKIIIITVVNYYYCFRKK